MQRVTDKFKELIGIAEPVMIRRVVFVRRVEVA